MTHGVMKMIYGINICKFKRYISLSFLICVLCNYAFSIDKKSVYTSIVQNTKYSQYDIEKMYFVNDDYCVSLIKEHSYMQDLQTILISSYAETRYELINSRFEDYNYKYIELIENTSAFLADATFDGCTDIIWLKGFERYIGFEIIKLDYDLKNEYLSFLSYSSVDCLGANPRITGPDYLFLNDFKFCIVNGKRGVRAYSIGKIRYDENKVYYALMNEDRDSHYFFFYWDKNEQRYILDETVTDNQLKNAYCPEDYFAYNGLKFSKLDSKLTDADLKDLDKAQLRLMRNAVYARHGRTFKSVDLQSLWECYTWYKKNPNYSDSLLTDIDKYNIELIQKYEQK